ncbi:FIVAR domain-containing protein [Gardnerella vaginalis]|uniref:FIVAR domain-containing protein n=1 Tax=Gardnerella vaginalis TaxID=2702 RepID=UPI0007F91C20|nr:FIVAR domain-containing protein [Gardnerella vaginalis]PKY96657.1 peptidase [Gardnerella vaginalis]
MTTKSAKHANKTSGSVKDKAAKVVDMHKVAALSAGAAGVIAGAAIAFGATPAMAAEAGVAAPVKTTEPVKEQELTNNKKKAEGAEASKGETTNSEVKKEAKKEAKKEEPKKEQTKPAEQAVAKSDGNTDVTKTETGSKVESTASVDNKDVKQDTEGTSASAGSVVNKRTKRSLDEDKQPGVDAPGVQEDRASNNDGNAANQDSNKIKPNTTDSNNTKIEINENNAETMPNAYAWGSSDNTYSVDGEKHTVTFHFAKPKDGNITSIAIFPSKTNGFNNEKSERGIDFYSKNSGKHQAYSGEYIFAANPDGSATLTMSTLFRDGNLNGGAEKYTASRSIFVYVTKDGSSTETIAYKTNVFRAVTLVPPKTSGSVVLKYNQELTPEKVQAAITEAGNVETARSDKKSVNDQLSGKFTENINVSSADAYDKTTFDAINKETSAQGATNKTYVAGAKTLNTYMVTDLGFKSGAIPLTVARYDDRIDKPIVEDPTQLSQEVKEDIAKKLAKINGVTTDKITFDADGNAVIHFDGVDENDAPKIALRDLVLKKIAEADVTVPTGDKAVFVANPLDYSTAELNRIKQSILEANKNNQELGLTSVDQISLSYLTGDLTATGSANTGISNGQAENTITVKIKTDKAVAEFTSDVKASKLTKLPNIRTDYDVTWTSNKIDKRDTDEGLSWSEDKKTIIYRYDPTAAQEFDTNKILNLLKATPKGNTTGLPTLTGGEKFEHEGAGGKAKKSHVGYVLKDDQPTTELSLGNMDGAYWKYSRQVDNSGVNLGDEESNAGSYSWDEDAKPVVVAAKGNKVYKARLFVLPYGLTMYRNIYIENGKNPGNTTKAINVIFVPQTNHKKADLKASVDKHAVTKDEKKTPTDSTYYNASDAKKAAYDEALKKANDALKEAGNTEDSKLSEELKARIDNATIRLDKARAALDGAKTDKSKLEQDIKDQGNPKKDNTAASGTYETDKYKNVTEPSFLKDEGGKLVPDTDKNNKAAAAKTAYDKALEEANKVSKDANATQKAVDEAKAKLDEARKELDKYSTNKDKLNAAIAEHGQVKTGKTDSGTDINKADPAYQNANVAERKAYDDAVKKANDLSKDPKASQKDVNEAITALENAKAALDAKATDKTKLAVAVQQTFDNPDPDNANGQKSTFYKNALGKKANGSEEEKAKAAAAIKAYDEALKKAKDILADANGTATQAQVDAAVTALTDAEDKLHEGYSTNKNDLTKALADNIDGYLKPAYFNAFDKAQAGDQKAQQAFKDYNEAYQKAKELKKKFAETDLSKQPTDEECKTAKEALEKARQVIDKYATDTSKLSAAFWNDLAIHNSPAYKNAQALVDKQNPTEDEKAQVAAAKKIKKDYDDAVAKLHKAFSNTLDKDKDAQGTPFAKIPDPNGDLNAKNYLDGIQAHENGEPLDRDVTRILTAMNDAADQLKQFATKTDKLQESINKDTDTQKDPAYKNARDPHKLGADGLEDTSGYDAIKQKAKAYDDALKDAKALMIKPDATQEDVNAALKKLDEARTALEGYKTNVEDLKKSVEAHGSTDGPAVKEGTVTSDAYRNASDPHFLTADGKPDGQKNNKAATDKKAYDAALLKAQDLLKKADPDSKTPLDAQPTQKQIDEALTELNEKRKALDTYKTDTSKLDEEAKKSTAEGATVADVDFEATPEFKNAKAKTSDGNENADVTAYKTALANARDLVKAATSTDPNTKNSNRPTQQQVDEALASLKKAKKQIEDNYKTNFEALTSAKDFADDGFKKTPEYKNALAKKDAGDQGATKDLGEAGQDTGFDNVLKKVTDKLNDTDWKGKVTQKFVNELLKKLQTAQDNIANKYKTDAIKLEYEVGDKNQDGKPVTPPFEASVPYKNALEKAKTEDPATTDPNSATKKLEAYNEKLKAAQELINKVNNPDPNAKPEDRPTQAQVDKALQDLKDAKTAIDNAFKTNASSLKKEADDKDETGQEHNPKFEQTTEYLNALAKKTGDEDIPDVKAYKDALKKAQDLLKKFNDDGSAPKQGEKDIPTQKEVDEALKNLKDIKDKITKNYVTSPHDLQEEVDKSKDGEDDTSTDVFENTPEFKNATAKGDDAAKQALKDYNDKLDAAKKLLDAFDRTTGKPKSQLPKGMDKAPTQQELDKALKDLQDAKKKITDGYKTNKSDLNTEAGKDSDFTKTPEYQNAQAKGDDASKQALEDYKKALEDANKVLGDKDATQAQVDEALKKLQDAKKKLSDGYKTDKSDLTVEAGKDSDFTQSPEYQNAAGSSEAEAYKQALEDANKVLGDKNATQAQVDEALRRLKDAKQKLTDSHKTDKSDLNTEAGKDPDFRKSIPFIIGKAADLAEYQQALNDADSVLKDPNATQDQVNRALRRLRDAKQKLIDAYNRLINSGSGVGDNTGVGVNDSNNTSVNNVVDKSALQAEADQALGDVSANASGVVADSNLVSEFNAALNYARSVLADANATQGQVDSALARLRAARAALRAGMLVARNSAGMNLKRGDVSGVNTGASSSVFAAFAAVFAGLGVVGAASKRRKHSAR